MAAKRRKLAINRLRESRTLDQQTLERFVDRHEFPIVEGTQTTFVAWQQHADEVFLRHRVVGIPDPLPMRRIEGSDLFYVVVEIPRESRVEYQLEKRQGDHWERFNDPLNPRTARSPVGTPRSASARVTRCRTGPSTIPTPDRVSWSSWWSGARRSGATTG